MTEAGPPPIGVYVHWPYCARICPYCDFNVVRDRGRRAEQAALVAAILADLRAQAAMAGPRRLLSIFFGGGTPSLMTPDAVTAIIEEARRLFIPADDLEVSLEANPTDAEAGKFADLAGAGVNRLSLGVQSLDDAALKFLGRNHDVAQAKRAIKAGRASFARLSIDLIYALPIQTPAAWAAELAAAADMGAEHVAPYQLTIEAGTPFDRAVRREAWSPPDDDLGAALYETTQDVLGAAGFTAYEVSNHARGLAAQSRHNLIYWRGQDYLGVGPGSHGRLTDGEGRRWASEAAAGVGDYAARVSGTGVGFVTRERLSARDVALERLLMGLRTVEGVALAELEPLGIAEATLHGMSEAGLIDFNGDRIVVSLVGRAVLDRITFDLAASGAK